MAYADEEIIQVLNNVKAPYNMNKLTSEAAIKAFDHIHVMEDHINNILKVQ